MSDVWEISMINPVATERKQLDYPTQKPEALLERIIKASTNEQPVTFQTAGKVYEGPNQI
jgi:DNA modification methylase